MSRGALLDASETPPRAEEPPKASMIVRDTGQLAVFRGFLSLQATKAQMQARLRHTLIAAANEAVTNALCHGAPPYVVHVHSNGDELVVDVIDRGGTPFTPGDGIETARLLVRALVIGTGNGLTQVQLRQPLRDAPETQTPAPELADAVR
ncbi:hypothetical protein EDD29_0027 [Actinocorallia herbida]|uniref:Anti-sigma regulatory factor (Ser/Thr protein kinase) n=1 Tax=Actinocorallia herbida TaxID=58109 RepID=A0A3N1CMK2_9ACTN|nr:hypothetical protein [Actinocorallia herbida]ROO82547.1 hypothetical protein EDD29_0027 [Actinocorallia herbida]